MRNHFTTFFVFFIALVFPTTAALAQHAGDIEFSYSGGKIDIVFGPEGPAFESDFPTTGSFEQFTDEPGFISQAAEGLGINPDDIIDYNVLGPLKYHNGTSFAAVPSGAQIEISDNPSGGLFVSDTTVGPVSGTGVIGQADGAGDFHWHMGFDLLPIGLDTPEYGAYGLLMELVTDEPAIAASDPFYIVFNFGLDEQVFDGAVEDFAAAVPEPSSLALAALGCGLIGVAGRRRRTKT